MRCHPGHFGTGISSFTYLRQVPVDGLKIDGSLIRRIRGSPVDHAIVRSIAEIGHGLGARTVAEAVEDAETLRMVRARHRPGAGLRGRPGAAARPGGLMRDYIQRRREEREYDEFLRRKIEIARSSMRAGRGRSNEDVEAEFAARRAELLGEADETGA